MSCQNIKYLQVIIHYTFEYTLSIFELRVFFFRTCQDPDVLKIQSIL